MGHTQVIPNSKFNNVRTLYYLNNVKTFTLYLFFIFLLYIHEIKMLGN